MNSTSIVFWKEFNDREAGFFKVIKFGNIKAIVWLGFFGSWLKILDTSFVNQQQACIPKLKRAFLIGFVGWKTIVLSARIPLHRPPAQAQMHCDKAHRPGNRSKPHRLCRALGPRWIAGSGEVTEHTHACYLSKHTKYAH